MLTPSPKLPDFTLCYKSDIVQLVNSYNVHQHTATCYKYAKKSGNPVCRMRMPQTIIQESSIDPETGEVKLKRLHETINNFNEYIISACRSNMDIKYIFTGNNSKALVYYSTDYVTKSNLSFFDTFSLILKATQSMKNHKTNTSFNATVEEKSCKLV